MILGKRASNVMVAEPTQRPMGAGSAMVVRVMQQFTEDMHQRQMQMPQDWDDLLGLVIKWSSYNLLTMRPSRCNFCEDAIYWVEGGAHSSGPIPVDIDPLTPEECQRLSIERANPRCVFGLTRGQMGPEAVPAAEAVGDLWIRHHCPEFGTPPKNELMRVRYENRIRRRELEAHERRQAHVAELDELLGEFQ